MYINRFKPLMA